MDKCQSQGILWLAVLAMLMSVISAAAAAEAAAEQNVFRRYSTGPDTPANTDIDNDTDIDVTFMEEMSPCYGEMECFAGSVIESVTSNVVQLHLDSVINELPDDCAETPHCDVSGCTDEYMLRDFRLKVELFDLACANKAQIESGAACWKPPFRSNVIACFERYRPDTLYSPTMTSAMDCLATVPEGIDTCNHDDVTFFDNLTDQMLLLARLTYGERQ